MVPVSTVSTIVTMSTVSTFAEDPADDFLRNMQEPTNNFPWNLEDPAEEPLLLMVVPTVMSVMSVMSVPVPAESPFVQEETRVGFHSILARHHSSICGKRKDNKNQDEDESGLHRDANVREC